MNVHQQSANNIACFILRQKGSNLANLSMESLAKTFKLNINELREITLDNDGTSIDKFLNLQKVFLAMKTLEKNPQITTKDLAASCGFTDHDTFTREFTNYFLIDPQKCIDIKANAPFLKRLYNDL